MLCLSVVHRTEGDRVGNDFEVYGNHTGTEDVDGAGSCVGEIDNIAFTEGTAVGYLDYDGFLVLLVGDFEVGAKR